MKNQKNIISLLSILIFIIFFFLLFFFPVESNSFLISFFQIIIIFSFSFLIIFLNRKLLREDWWKFKKNIWKNLLLGVLWVIFMFLILKIVRIPINALSTWLEKEQDIFSLPLIISIPLIVFPLVAAFIEEIVFRHHLFFIFKNKYIKILMLFVSSILFGFIHYNNFNWDILQLVPYMFIGFFLALAYQYSKNIWTNISFHLLFNSINVFLGLIWLIIIKFIWT